MSKITHTFAILTLLSLGLAKDDSKGVALFDGKTLSGWEGEPQGLSP